MSMQLIAILASAGLMTAGVAATSETRSASAIPAASVASISKVRSVPTVRPARQGNRPDCGLEENRNLPACANPGRGGAAGGSGGVSGGVLAALAAAIGAGGLFVALKNDSNG